MRLWHILRTRLRSLFFRGRRESDLSEELQLHLERETERLRASGLSPDAARLQALRTFGGVEQVREECRDARGTAFVDDAVRDVLYALRAIQARAAGRVHDRRDGGARARPGRPWSSRFLNAFLFRVDQVPNVHEMFAVERPRNRRRRARSLSRARSSTRSVARPACSPTPTRSCPEVDSRVDGRMMAGTFVTGNFFQVLGVNAAMGRTLTPADDEPLCGTRR